MLSSKYSDCCWLTSHNSFSNKKDKWLYRQQNLSIEEQFAVGVRAFMLDIYAGNLIKHTDSKIINLISKRFTPLNNLRYYLRKFKSLLRDHPLAIITIIFESYVDDADILADFELMELDHMIFNGDVNTRLQKMIFKKQRIVVIINKPSDMFLDNALIIQNQYNLAKYPRGDELLSSRGQLRLFNHFPTYSFCKTNNRALIKKRIEAFTAATKGNPNFIAINFVDQDIADYIADLIDGFVLIE